MTAFAVSIGLLPIEPELSTTKIKSRATASSASREAGGQGSG